MNIGQKWLYIVYYEKIKKALISQKHPTNENISMTTSKPQNKKI
jgi:hypothetical protein